MAITGTTGSTSRALTGDMTVEEFRQWMRRFDVNGDGRISRDELRRAIRAVGGRFSGWRSGRWIRQADADGDGLIDDREIDNLIRVLFDCGCNLNVVFLWPNIYFLVF